MKLSDGKLSEEQLAFFYREGYFIAENVLNDNEIEPLRQELAAAVDKKLRQMKSEGRIEDTHEGESFEKRTASIFLDNEQNGAELMYHLEGYMGGGFRGREIFRLIQHPKLLRLAESIIGSELVSSSIYRLRTKVPGDKMKEVPWHQDAGYFAGQCDPHLILTFWIPLVKATKENGCLKILPRAHKQGIIEHFWCQEKKGYLVIEEEDLPERGQKTMAAQVDAGSVVVLTNMTPHSSASNLTDKVRWSIDVRYQNPKTPNNIGLKPHLNQADHLRNVELACYPPEADFIVQSRENPETVVNFDQFMNLRETYYHHYTKGDDYPAPSRWTHEPALK